MEAQVAWRELIAALDASLPGPAAASFDMQPALAALRGAFRDAVLKTDFETRPRQGYDAVFTDIVDAAAPSCFAAPMRALAAVREGLPWAYHYAPRPGEVDPAGRIGFAELIGPDGPMAAPDVRVGLTLLAAHTAYPMHAHPAVELYWVMAGHARWTTRRDERIVPPGGFVLHRSGEPHAMLTFEEPLLALWGWSGDVDTPAYYV
jgi:mannose-6-phosphate isomerase-like protein (cupin superfamily)